MVFPDLRGLEGEVPLAYLERLQGKSALVWPKQARRILMPFLHSRVTIVDAGCATGYAYNAFADFDPFYTGIEFAPERLEAAKSWHASNPRVKFLEHDFVLAPIPTSGETVLCSATLEHCPTLMPALEHLALATEKVLYLRTFLGNTEILAKSPKIPNLYINQYAISDVLIYLNQRGFKTQMYRDEYTRSLPYYISGVVRCFYIILATRVN